MIRNYFKTAWRNLKRNKLFSIINISGLAIGLMCCLFLALYVHFELSFDKFHSKADRIARVITIFPGENGDSRPHSVTSAYVLPSFKENFPKVETGTRLYSSYEAIANGEKSFDESILNVDSTFFDVFDFKLIEGDPKDLKDPNKIFLTPTMGRKYFGEHNPVGKTLLVGDDKMHVTVAGIAEDVPKNSQITYNFLRSVAPILKSYDGKTYYNADFSTYLLFKNPKSSENILPQIPALVKSVMGDKKVGFEFEPLLKIHLYSSLDAIVPNVSINYIYISIGIASLILIIACFTYINMSVASSTKRAREVGIRKVTGAGKKSIFWQFIIESLVLTLSAVVVSFLLSYVFLGVFNRLAQTQFVYKELFQPAILLVIILLLLFIAFFAGSYPAIVLSRFKEVTVLKGNLKGKWTGNWIQNSFILFQFVVSSFLIIAMITMMSQMKYIQQKKLGYTRDNIIRLNGFWQHMKQIEQIKANLKTNPNILAVSAGDWSPVTIGSGRSIGLSKEKSIQCKGNPVDPDYLNTCGIKLIAGRDFTLQDIADVTHQNRDLNIYHYLVNEETVKALNSTPKNIIGKNAYIMGGMRGEIIGVIENFHFASLRNKIEPLVLMAGPREGNLLIRVRGENLESTIDFIKNKYKSWLPAAVFNYYFLDEDYQKMYESEKRINTIIALFSVISIVLACAGIFGLAAFTARLRVKEIGVRKVLGASVINITALLAGSFIRLIVLAFIIATGISIILMNKWLQTFAYRIDLNATLFILAGIILFMSAFLVIAYHSLKVALDNPIKSLRTE